MAPSFWLLNIFLVFFTINAGIVNGAVKFKLCVLRNGKEECWLNPKQRPPNKPERSTKEKTTTDPDFFVNHYAKSKLLDSYRPEDLDLDARHEDEINSYSKSKSAFWPRFKPSHFRGAYLPPDPRTDAGFYPANVYVYHSSYPGINTERVHGHKSNRAHSHTNNYPDLPIQCTFPVPCGVYPECCKEEGLGKKRQFLNSPLVSKLDHKTKYAPVNRGIVNPGANNHKLPDVPPPDCSGVDPCFDPRCPCLRSDESATIDPSLDPADSTEANPNNEPQDDSGFDPNFFPTETPPDCTGVDPCFDPRCVGVVPCSGTSHNSNETNSDEPLDDTVFNPNSFPTETPPDCTGVDPCFDPRCIGQVPCVRTSHTVNLTNLPAIPPPDCTGIDPCFDRRCVGQVPCTRSSPNVNITNLPAVPPPDCTGIDPCFDPRCAGSCLRNTANNANTVVNLSLDPENVPDANRNDQAIEDPGFDPNNFPNTKPVNDPGFDIVPPAGVADPNVVVNSQFNLGNILSRLNSANFSRIFINPSDAVIAVIVKTDKI